MAHFSDAQVRQIILTTFANAGLTSSEVNFALQVVIGESGFDEHIPGDAGEAHGIFQLHDRGLLPGFYSAGFSDWTDPNQQARFVANYIKQNRGDGYNGWQPWTVARNIINGVEGFGADRDSVEFVNTVRGQRNVTALPVISAIF